MPTRSKQLPKSGESSLTESAIPLDTEAAWAAVSTRDSLWDGRIFYAVQSTGIYCRPSCSSRRPYRDHVHFFQTADEAEQAGYEACDRCHPNDMKLTSSERAVQRALEYLAGHQDTRVMLDVLARKAGMTLSHFQRTFTRIVGMSPKQYGDALRRGLFKTDLRQGKTPDLMTKTALSAEDTKKDAAKHILRHHGMSSATHKRRGQDTTIHYMIVDTTLGCLLAATTDRGICAITLGDDDGVLESDLEHEYPNAILQRLDNGSMSPLELDGEYPGEKCSEHLATFRTQVASVVAQVEGEHPHVSIPLDVTSTPFEQIVWDALRKIPYGEIRTYTDLAIAVGRPESVRAVAQACAKNLVAVVIPCHRVLRKDGSMGGYRWGIQRKTELLKREKRGF